MSRIRISLVAVLLIVLLSLSTVVNAASSQRFCKCTCFKNSTIIPLTLTHDPTNDKDPNPPPKGTKPGDKPRDDNKPAPSSPPAVPPPPPGNTDRDPCKQCNIAFCLSYNLPICKDADPEKDVKTFCFQRDRTEDQVIVWSFILGTLGLLGWAGIRGVVEARDRREMAAQAAAGGRGGGQQGGGSSLPFNTAGNGSNVGGGGGILQRILGLGGAGRSQGGGGGTYAPLDDTAR
ncbi:hypothetical protein V8F20_011231 [Naviculisporaceae sp. PSN 640]